MAEIRTQIGPPLIPGRLYRYILDLPRGCKDGVYRLVRFILDVPSYQKKVLVCCIEGKDAGLWFTCTENNFAQRYELADLPPLAAVVLHGDPPPEKVADFSSRGMY